MVASVPVMAVVIAFITFDIMPGFSLPFAFSSAAAAFSASAAAFSSSAFLSASSFSLTRIS